MTKYNKKHFFESYLHLQSTCKIWGRYGFRKKIIAFLKTKRFSELATYY